MVFDLILASTSQVRSALLSQAGLPHRVLAPRVDEESAKLSLLADGASPRDIADALAEMKARKIAEKEPAALVLGCDQTLSLGKSLFSKAASQDEAKDQLARLQGQTHHLESAIVLYENARPVWRHLAEARMTMRPLSPAFLSAYIERNWPAVSYTVGGYMIEAEGISLFSDINGEHSGILGLPLPPLVGYLATRGFIAS